MVWGRRRDFLPGSQEVKWRDGNPPTNAWLPGFITAYNTRFGRDPANAKDLHRPLTPADDLDEILAWREERTVTRNLTLHYDRMMLLLDPNISGPSLGAPEGGSGELPGRPVRGSVQRSNARFQGVRQDPNRAARRDIDNKRLSAVLEQVKAHQATYPARQQRGHVARQRPPNNLEAPGPPSKGRGPTPQLYHGSSLIHRCLLGIPSGNPDATCYVGDHRARGEGGFLRDREIYPDASRDADSAFRRVPEADQLRSAPGPSE